MAELGGRAAAGLGRASLPRPIALPNGLSLRTQVIAGSLAVAAVVTVTYIVLLVAMSDLQGSTNAQARSRDVTVATLAVERVVNQLDLSLRGFIITDNQRLLLTWDQARSALGPAIGRVNALVAKQPGELANLNNLSALVNAYVGDYGERIIYIAGLSRSAASQPIVTQEGLTRVKAIRASLGRLLTDENARASAQAASAKHRASHAFEAAIVALVAIVSLLVLFGIFLVRGIVRPVRTVADGASRVAAGDLSTRLDEGGAAEINQVRTAFNEMADSLQRGQRDLELQNEELRESERLKSELVSIVAHELRTPLASVIGYTSLLLRRTFDQAATTHYLEIIRAEGNRLSALIDDFLDVERVQAGRIVLKDESIDLKPILVGESRLLDRDASKHTMVLTIGPDALRVRGDADRLSQVYGNLVANAVKYSPDGGPIEIAGNIVGDNVRVQVTDHGIGIPDEHQSRIFTKFFRADARERGFDGTGLGLSVSREIVEAHGGRMGFTSTPGTGSMFWFELPLDGTTTTS